MNSPTSWHFDASSAGSIGRLHETSSGISLIIPGAPVHLGPVRLGRLAFDALVQLQQLPIAVGVRLDRHPAVMNPAAMCTAMAQALARGRSGQPVTIAAANDEQLTRWGAEAAGSAIYRLAQAEPSGADSEEIVFFARPSVGEQPPVLWQLVLVKLFDSHAVDPIRWAMFNAALMGSLRWAPDAPPVSVLSPWPQSAWLDGGLELQLPLPRQSQVAELSLLLRGAGGDLSLLRQRLKMLACGNDPPHQSLDPENRTVMAQLLGDASPGPELPQYWTELLAEVFTAHDLRGLALVGLRSLVAATSASPVSSLQ